MHSENPGVSANCLSPVQLIHKQKLKAGSFRALHKHTQLEACACITMHVVVQHKWVKLVGCRSAKFQPAAQRVNTCSNSQGCSSALAGAEVPCFCIFDLRCSNTRVGRLPTKHCDFRVLARVAGAFTTHVPAEQAAANMKLLV